MRYRTLVALSGVFLCATVALCALHGWTPEVADEQRYEYIFGSAGEPWTNTVQGENVLFSMRGSHSTDFGGMGSASFREKELPQGLILGRTWSDSGAWTDHSYRYTARLQQGEGILLSYNATEPINIRFSSGSKVLTQETRITGRHSYLIPETGNYTLKLAVNEPRTAVVSLRCVYLHSGPGSSKTGNTENVNTFPPSVAEIKTLQGKLHQASIPGVEGPVMALETNNRWNGSKTYPLHLGLGEGMLPSPCGGYTMLGNMSLFEINDAYLNNVTVQVEGFPFTHVIEGTSYEAFHVNAVKPLEQGALPLYAVQTMEVISGRFHECLSGYGREYFPIEFTLGFDDYMGHHGNIERFYHVQLGKGDTIGFSFNASGPVEFGLYGNHGDSYGTRGFSRGDPEDYHIRESRIESYEAVFTAPRRGYYSFAFKAYSGEKTVARLDAWRITLIGIGFTP
ncbi:hypothetical protein JXL21_01055 [Candidatus Bathyarchaeota archaeon]|nr:hypothetical protein [Candidatus Bathyarchaeota archaeon]